MRARAVIGANYGDEGKGLVTDYLCATEGAGVVVRFNGGAQAGHTVVTPAGRRHVFSHIGSGAFLGIPTFLSKFFVCNPLLFSKEWMIAPKSEVYADPESLVTTFADMLWNQRLENERGEKRHGSCGVGFGSTIVRDQDIPLRMKHLWSGGKTVEIIVHRICQLYCRSITEEEMEHFLRACYDLASVVAPANLRIFRDPVFEGAQGLLLDQNRTQDLPHLTRSNTGLANVRALCAEAGIEDIDPYYVSRTYVTRHGAGPLPGEDPNLVFPDDTNVVHPYQGSLRFAPIDYPDLYDRCLMDALGEYKLVLTHCDQREPQYRGEADFVSHGPTRNHIEKV